MKPPDVVNRIPLQALVRFVYRCLPVLSSTNCAFQTVEEPERHELLPLASKHKQMRKYSINTWPYPLNHCKCPAPAVSRIRSVCVLNHHDTTRIIGLCRDLLENGHCIQFVTAKYLKTHTHARAHTRGHDTHRGTHSGTHRMCRQGNS